MSQSTIAIIIVVIAIISFVLEKIPMALTASLAAIAMGMFGIIEIKDVYSNFGSLSVIMVGAMMIVGDSVFESGLANVIGKKLVSVGLGNNQKKLVIVMTVFAMVASAFFSNSAVVAMMIPLIASVVVESNGKVQNKYVLMAVGMGASAGGFCTLAGCTPQLVTQAFLTDNGYTPMKFFDLAKAGVPMCILMLIYFITIGYWLEKKIFTFDDIIPGLETVAEDEKEAAPKWKMILVGVVALLCIAGFISGIWDLAFVALLGVCVLALTGCINLTKSMKNLDWNTLIIIAM